MTGVVEFISYDGKYPNLCGGRLVLGINGIPYTFGYKRNDHEPFWSSGGKTGFRGQYNDAYVLKDEWIINVDVLPVEIRKYANEIIEEFNNNVPYGCCGGCL